MIYNKHMTQIHVTLPRETKYTLAVRSAVSRLRHATNAEIAAELRIKYPYVSDTTVHRVTQRLWKNGELALAPATCEGALRYDANPAQHDHFLCRSCERLVDMQVPQACRALIQYQLGGCRVGGSLTISGDCEKCRTT